MTVVKDVVVTRDHGDEIEILAKFVTVKEAENFVALRERVDPVGVGAGIYGIDAPWQKQG